VHPCPVADDEGGCVDDALQVGFRHVLIGRLAVDANQHRRQWREQDVHHAVGIRRPRRAVTSSRNVICRWFREFAEDRRDRLQLVTVARTG